MARSGASSIGLLSIIGLALVLAFMFLWRVWTYERQISKGETIELPQYAALFTPSKNGGKAPIGTVADVATLDDPAIGPADAKLTIVEFLDYECPFCNAESSVVRELSNKYSDKVRLIVRDFPVPELHPHAIAAAEAAGCAEAQGKFWPMHDRLFAAAADGTLTPEEIEQSGEQSGVDLPVFRACLRLETRLEEIQQDAADGLTAGVRGTPTFFLNGRRVEGAIPKQAFETLIRKYVAP